jgi:hypothetical protein
LAGFGEIPKPTVQSGWEKMEVWQRLKKVFERLLSIAFSHPFSLKFSRLEGFLWMFGSILPDLPF